MTTENLSPDEVAAVQKCEQAYNKLRDELAKVIVGQNEVIEQVLIAVFSRGHALALARRAKNIHGPERCRRTFVPRSHNTAMTPQGHDGPPIS